ncbi:hypothetical protein JYU34_004571 [Plutella xylostella]|uniref:Renin receptor n=1 Tax=Plutella xylostella TaxID=51655 RepID=A0ABQ7QYA9_PLUXY|nr:hypothetical protein JYU34_004571 [Plutella xylostella]
MAGKKVLFLFSLVLAVIGTNAVGELRILHSPDSLKFQGSSGTQESVLKDIFSASLGLSVEEDSEWNGLSIVDPFKTPEAVVEVYIDGISSLGNVENSKVKTFPLKADEYEPETFQMLKHRINQRFSDGSNTLINVKLSDPAGISSLFGDMAIPKVSKQSLQHLKQDQVEEDYSFLQDLAVLKAITEKVSSGAISPDNSVDFYNLRVTSLHALSDYHGPSSMQTKEAKKLLVSALEELSRAFVQAYDGAVLVTAVTSDIEHTRRARAVAAPREFKLNDDDAYSVDYAAIFNIILWFGVVFAFSLIAIVYALIDMDPGRDSIIYRMTSTRMKKDN